MACHVGLEGAGIGEARQGHSRFGPDTLHASHHLGEFLCEVSAPIPD
jgi:hypothetical protein